MDIKELFENLKQYAKGVDYFELRSMRRYHEQLQVRQGVVEAPSLLEDHGVMITVFAGQGSAYAATANLTPSSLRQAFDEAKSRAFHMAKYSIFPFSSELFPAVQGTYHSPVVKPWDSYSIKTKYDLLKSLESQLAKGDSRCVDSMASLSYRKQDVRIYSSNGTEILQEFDIIQPHLSVTVHDKNVTEMRTFGAHAMTRQGGLEVLESTGFAEASERIHQEALQLLYAPQCPSGLMSLLLAPDQMILQIHESIGHPLEIDRILGDERNYAGTSFVKPDMFGSYQYGSKLLDVSFDPTYSGELASYQFDDQGTPAQKAYLIREGLLVSGLGGALSQQRSGLPGVANSRSVSWNRPPIDRMANINIEPGKSSMEEMVSSVEFGVYMETNCSWSIDDSRNKFQFGCELGRVIRNGTLCEVVRKPNYRGISAEFWRNLTAVGNHKTVDVMGTPNCGKGEPNQAITVGHASPACLFSQVEVFGGES